MKTAGRELDDEDLAAYMKRSGLGPPATRAAIIERLWQSGYVERSKCSSPSLLLRKIFAVMSCPVQIYHFALANW